MWVKAGDVSDDSNSNNIINVNNNNNICPQKVLYIKSMYFFFYKYKENPQNDTIYNLQ